MKVVSHYVKKYILDVISTNVTYGGDVVPIYGDVPASASEPYMVVETVGQTDMDRNSDDFGYDAQVRLEVVTKFGRAYQDSSISEIIMNQALELIRPNPNSTLDMSADSFSNYGIDLISTNMVKEEYPDNIYVRLITDLAFYVQES